MTVTVTGGAGFIGSNLVDELLTQGMQVRVLDDFSEGREENLRRWRGNKNLEIIRGSILDYNLVRRAVDHSSCVFHLAADSRIQTGIMGPIHSITTNVVGTANVAEACRERGVARIVYSASSSAYGNAAAPAMPLSEDMSTDCLNPYSMSKKAGEDIMDVYHRLYGISTVSLRYFNVYGPRHQETGRYATVIAIFRRQLRLGQPMTIVGDGFQRRDFTFVSDVVRANMFAMMDRTATGVFNIGRGENYSIMSLAARVAGKDVSELVEGKDFVYIPKRLGEAISTKANIEKANRELSWYPSVGLDDGLKLLDHYEKIQGIGDSGIIIVGS